MAKTKKAKDKLIEKMAEDAKVEDGTAEEKMAEDAKVEDGTAEETKEVKAIKAKKLILRGRRSFMVRRFQPYVASGNESQKSKPYAKRKRRGGCASCGT